MQGSSSANNVAIFSRSPFRTILIFVGRHYLELFSYLHQQSLERRLTNRVFGLTKADTKLPHEISYDKLLLLF